MSVRKRLLASFGLVTAVMLAPSLFAASRLSQLSSIAIDGRANHATAVTRLGRMLGLVTDLDRLERSFVATDDVALGLAAVARGDSLRQLHDAFLASPYGHIGPELEPTVDEILSLVSEVDARMREGRVDAATDRVETLLSRFRGATLMLQAMADSIDAQAAGELSRASTMITVARTQTLLGLGLALILALLSTGVTTHSLTAPLRRLSRGMAAVADGVLRAPDDLPYDRDDEIGDLSASFGVMTRKLAALDRKKSEFLGMVSHELKTPINVVNAYSEILREDLTDLPQYHLDLIEAVGEQAKEMARRVSRLMDLSRLEAGTYQLRFDTVPTARLMADLLATFKRRAGDEGVALETTISPCVPNEVVMDADIIRDEVLGNLILNAIRYTPAGGRIEVSLDTDEDGIRIVVADTGPGIPEQHRGQIFRKHYVADRTRTVGCGLGLAIAKEMVELHGGIICLEDATPEWGARFRVSLPLKAVGSDVELPSQSFFGRRTRNPAKVA